MHTKSIVTKSVSHFANVLGLSPLNHHEMKVRSRLNTKIIQVVKHKSLTNIQVAKLSNTYPMSIAAILNRQTQDISTNLMLRVLVSLGVRAKNATKIAA